MNKNGWAMKKLLIFVSIFLFGLLVSAYLIVKTTHDVNLKNEPNDMKEELNVDDYYSELEANVYEAAREYVTNNRAVLNNGSITIKLKTLISDGYLATVDDEYGTECSGYINVESADEIKYEVYLKCTDYQTTGYDEQKDI